MTAAETAGMVGTVAAGMAAVVVGMLGTVVESEAGIEKIADLAASAAATLAAVVAERKDSCPGIVAQKPVVGLMLINLEKMHPVRAD